MANLWSMLQNPVFLICLFTGTFVVLKFCFDQFDKPAVSQDENDPWKFVAPRNLTPPRQYLVGFSVYCGSLLLLFLGISLVGPDKFHEITHSLGLSNSELDGALKSSSTFPFVVAFLIVGLYPNLPIPKWLDVEIVIRRLAHRIAYIPKNMDLIFNYMRFSDFDLPQEKIDNAWNAIGLRRLVLDSTDCGSIRPLLDRTVLLYVRALNLATDGEVDNIRVMQDLSVEVFRQYRDQIQQVELSIQAVYSRLSELNGPNTSERRKSIQIAHKELIKSLEFLYVVFACAITGKGMDRISKRLSTLGFRSTFEPDARVPWDPILKSLGAAAMVLAAAWFVAANTFLTVDKVSDLGIPTKSIEVLGTLIVILTVHLVATVESLRVRARLIRLDRYYFETGNPQAVAYIKLFAMCAIVCLASYLILNVGTLISAFAQTASSPDRPSLLTPAQVVWAYFWTYLVCSIVPACCGVMTAYTIERSIETRLERLASGVLQGAAMATAALLAVELTSDAPWGFRIFTLVLYGGLGLVLGYMLPAAIRRHWAAVEKRLPDKIAVLRTSVLQYFYNIQQFTEWLNVRNEGLNGRRPLDVLSEETGLHQLTSLVANTRTKVGTAELAVQ